MRVSKVVIVLGLAALLCIAGILVASRPHPSEREARATVQEIIKVLEEKPDALRPEEITGIGDNCWQALRENLNHHSTDYRIETSYYNPYSLFGSQYGPRMTTVNVIFPNMQVAFSFIGGGLFECYPWDEN